jgi:hypothetical protein
LNSIRIVAVLAVRAPSKSREMARIEADKESASSSFASVRTSKKIRRLYALTEIRRMAARGKPHNEIMSQLGLPPRTYFRYLQQVFENDRQFLLQQDKDMLMVELSIFRDRLLGAYRRLTAIASSESMPARDRIAAEESAAEVALAIVKVATEGPAIMRNYNSLITAIENKAPSPTASLRLSQTFANPCTQGIDTAD